MKAYLLSLAAGLLVGVVYSLLGVRSPAPPMIALVGLLGILFGEQIVPLASRILTRDHVAHFVSTNCREHILGQLPGGPAKHDENA
ncbi:MAG TPA: XapX domain-containing protein [Novosphingobium sp.]|nr:XapX domain-containing protein [Novosphingobium sp.]